MVKAWRASICDVSDFAGPYQKDTGMSQSEREEAGSNAEPSDRPNARTVPGPNAVSRTTSIGHCLKKNDHAISKECVMYNYRISCLLIVPLLPLCAAVACAQPSAQPASLGTVHFPTWGSPQAQAHFLRGVAALHAFWYPVALDEFRAATRIEPDFMMGYWGEAMAHNHPLWGRTTRDRSGAPGAQKEPPYPTADAARARIPARGHGVMVRKRSRCVIAPMRTPWRSSTERTG